MRHIDIDWDAIDASRRFIRSLYTGDARRPGMLFHYSDIGPVNGAPMSDSDFEGAARAFAETLRRRPIGDDDFVPAIHTGSGTCMLATAFGCREVIKNGVSWAEPAIHDPAEIDHLKKPSITAGRLGWALEQTRAYARLLDPRVGIRTIDFQSPFTTVEQILGSDLFFLMPYDAPGRLRTIMEMVTDFTIEFFQAQLAAAGEAACPGCWPSFWFPREAGIEMSDDNLTNVAPDVYDEFVVPCNNRIAEAFGGLFLHSCTIRHTNLPSIQKLRKLTGINWDISLGVRPAEMLALMGDRVVVAPHAYVNTETRYQSYSDFFEDALRGWRPGHRMFIHPCTVIYRPEESREITFDPAEGRRVMARFKRVA
jgi:hypothetical protein